MLLPGLVLIRSRQDDVHRISRAWYLSRASVVRMLGEAQGFDLSLGDDPGAVRCVEAASSAI
jgi:hypothetical protein